MIRWCAYCQRYQGEVAPYDDYAMTHSICKACYDERVYECAGGADLEPLRQFFARIANAGMGPSPSPAEVVAEGARLGLDPVDLLLGVVQPVLQQIGERWVRSEITISAEHRVTALCSALIQWIASADPSISALRDAHPPDVLLVAAEGNQHTLGIQIIEVLLLRHRVSSFAVYPGIPAEEIVALARTLTPKVVAISVAIASQLNCARLVAERVSAFPPENRPRVVVGGHAIREDYAPPGDVSIIGVRDPRALLELILEPPFSMSACAPDKPFTTPRP